jgi:hypothetical protein
MADTEQELQAGREAQKNDEEAKRKEVEKKLTEARRAMAESTLDPFQRSQKKATEEEIQKQLEKSDTSPVRLTPMWTPPGRSIGSEGDNANYNPLASTAPTPASGVEEEYDLHAGEQEPQNPDKYYPEEEAGGGGSGGGGKKG